ncbi:MAG TPA: acetyl-CoA carboxylase carboxyltransferase subunit beta [Candidatus Micrarchaeia archaeon]|nr:acetyl-CoA carboxylase carboxyltransferase subunit beta [Candidatus Micrarchaeia archaeon]
MAPSVVRPVGPESPDRPHPITGAAAAPRTGWSCPACRASHPLALAREQCFVCPTCAHHTRIGAHQRIAQLADPGSFREWDQDLAGHDRLGFVDTRPYRDRLAEAQSRHQLPDALLSGAARMGGHAVGLAAFDFHFMGGSLSAAVGERLARAAERCAASRTPFVCVTTSGGARMQEGVFSLLQMAKSVAALHTLAEAHMPFISILADPTMGGSIASFAALGDVIVAEPRATIGFTGARVIAQVTHEELPPGFQTSEFHHARGLIDAVVDRRELRPCVVGLLRVLAAPPGRAGAGATAA